MKMHGETIKIIVAIDTVMRKRLKMKSHFHGNTKSINLKIVPLCISYH